MLTFLIVGAAVVATACVLIIALARKASNSTVSKQPARSGAGLSAEQSAGIDKARSMLTNARMTISRIRDQKINQAGVKACDSVEKVLRTLREKPEKIQTNRQLFNYYLPTLEKVVSKYQRIESSGTMQSEMPAKVVTYLNDVTQAMKKMYDGLFDNDKLNVEVDMEAMTIAIRRDGLIDDEDFGSLYTGSKENTADNTGETVPEPAAATASVRESPVTSDGKSADPAVTAQPAPASQSTEEAQSEEEEEGITLTLDP